LVVATPVRIASPAPVTARRPRVLSRVVPYLTARGPAALQARLPPTVQTAALVGSGGQKKPWAATASCRAWLVRPGSTRAMRSLGSRASTRFMRSSESTTPPRTGTVAPVVPVPRPRATRGTPAALHSPTTAATCSWVDASTTASGSAWRRLLS
jgi:hypothetical protein